MKRKTRILTINNQQYAWWYTVGGGAEVFLSPKQDKTAQIAVNFPYAKEHPHLEYFPEELLLQKDNTEQWIKTVSPKMAAFLLELLTEAAFESRRKISLDGFAFLEKMGVSDSGNQRGFMLVEKSPEKVKLFRGSFLFCFSKDVSFPI